MKDIGVVVCYAEIPEGECDFKVYPAERADEIGSVRNDRLKREKYYVWKLLEYAVESVGFEFGKLNFEKTERGKWRCDKLCFSLSHTDGAVAVAISDSAVGVDIEAVGDRALKVAKKVFSKEELGDALTLSKDEAELYTTRLWTAKESIFKALDESVFSPQSIAISNYSVKTCEFEMRGKNYVISVSGKGAQNANFYKK